MTQLLLKRKQLFLGGAEVKKLSDWEMTSLPSGDSPRLKGQGLCISYATTKIGKGL